MLKTIKYYEKISLENVISHIDPLQNVVIAFHNNQNEAIYDKNGEIYEGTLQNLCNNRENRLFRDRLEKYYLFGINIVDNKLKIKGVANQVCSVTIP